MTATNCTCARITVGMAVTESRNWNPDCPEHGTQSDWHLSPEQVAKRQEQNERLVDLQRRARAARQAAKNGRSEGPASRPCNGDPCTCTNGIGCVSVPYDQW